MFEKIKKAAEGIIQFRDRVKEKAKEVRENKEEYLLKLEDRIEEQLILEVEKSDDFTLRLAAIDSGVYAKEMHTFEIIYIRTLSSIFGYQHGYLKESSIYPDFPIERLESISNDEIELLRFKNLARMEEEIKLAIDVLDKGIDVLLLDGSLLPLLSDKPREDSELYEFYKRVCKKYQKLYEKAFEKGIDVIGVIKDAKSKKLSKKLELGNVGVDTFFLEFLLKKGERTTIFKHTHEDKALFNLIPKARDILVFYLKASENDRPLRVEFLSSKSSFGDISSLMYFLSSLSENYSYPSILFEVDKRVAIRKEDIDVIDKYIMLHSNTYLEPRRRDNRPFR